MRLALLGVLFQTLAAGGLRELAIIRWRETPAALDLECRFRALAIRAPEEMGGHLSWVARDKEDLRRVVMVLPVPPVVGVAGQGPITESITQADLAATVS